MTFFAAPPWTLGSEAGHRLSSHQAGRWVRRAGVAAVASLIIVRVVDPTFIDRWAGAMAVGGILIGIPHGAVDHLVPFWASRRRVTPAALAGVLTRYLAVMAAAVACTLMFPLITVWAFLGASAWHFGRGEVAVAAHLAQRPLRRPRQDLLPALAHGGVTVGLPLAAWSDMSLPVLDRLAPGFAATPRPVIPAVLAAVTVLVPAACTTLLRRRRAGEAGELVLLAVLFTFVPPLAAFGVYFGLWHATRHMLRLVNLPGRDGGVDVRAGTVRYLYGAAIPTLASGGLLFALWRNCGSSILVAELALLIGLTAPHVKVVTALDRQAASR